MALQELALLTGPSLCVKKKKKGEPIKSNIHDCLTITSNKTHNSPFHINRVSCDSLPSSQAQTPKPKPKSKPKASSLFVPLSSKQTKPQAPSPISLWFPHYWDQSHLESRLKCRIAVRTYQQEPRHLHFVEDPGTHRTPWEKLGESGEVENVPWSYSIPGGFSYGCG